MAQKVLVKGAGGKTVELEEIHASQVEDARFDVLVSEDHLTAYLRCTASGETEIPPPDRLADILREGGIRYGIDLPGLELYATLLEENPTDEIAFAAAHGRPPTHGRNGEIDFRVRPTATEARYDEDESGKVDYRKLHLIQNIAKGQLIASLRPPTEGVTGRSVFGERFEARDGRPLRVKTGEGVRFDPETNAFFAEIPGRLVYEDEKLSISTVYEVPGDVDYRVGMIDFVGEVLIRGSVLDDFHVTGQRGITIHGRAGNCHLTSDGDITIHGGVAGKGEARLRAGGMLKTHYLNDVDVETGGNIEVQKEIVNCSIRTTGRIKIPTGAIIGGTVVAYQGIESSVLGSDLGVTTEVVAGVDWTAESEIQEIEAVLKKAALRNQRIRNLLDNLLKERTRLLYLTGEQTGILRELVSHLRTLRTVLEEAEEQKEHALRPKRSGRVRQINIHRHLYPGVKLRFPYFSHEIHENHRGPLSVIEDLDRETVRFVSQQPFHEDETEAVTELPGETPEEDTSDDWLQAFGLEKRRRE